jgi:hypothetical protein
MWVYAASGAAVVLLINVVVVIALARSARHRDHD